MPEPFARTLRFRLHDRSSLRITRDSAAIHWLFPSAQPRQARRSTMRHETAATFAVNPLGARNSDLQDLVAEVPAPLVSDRARYVKSLTWRGPDGLIML